MKESVYLTDEEREEIVYRYVKSQTEDEEPLTQAALAKEYGVCQRTVSNIILDSGILEKIRRRTKSNVLIAQAMAEEASAKAMRETIRSAFKKREDKFEYINQGDRRDILDRAGVRSEKKDEHDVTITLSDGGLNVGLPEDE